MDTDQLLNYKIRDINASNDLQKYSSNVSGIDNFNCYADEDQHYTASQSLFKATDNFVNS